MGSSKIVGFLAAAFLFCHTHAAIVTITGIFCRDNDGNKVPCSSRNSVAQAALVPGAGGGGGVVFVPDNTPPPTVTTVTVSTTTVTKTTTTTLPVGENVTIVLPDVDLPSSAADQDSLKDNITAAVVEALDGVKDVTEEDILSIVLHAGSVIAVVTFVDNGETGIANAVNTALDGSAVQVNVLGTQVTAQSQEGPAPTTTITTTTTVTTTTTTMTTSTRTQSAPNCCDLVQLTDPSCTCTFIQFFIPQGSDTAQCEMECPDGCCLSLKVETPDVPISGNGTVTLNPGVDDVGCLDTCCLNITRDELCCLEGSIDNTPAESVEELCFDPSLVIVTEEPEDEDDKDTKCDDDEAIIIIVVVLVVIVLISLLVACYFCMKQEEPVHLKT